jgi:hypothetical protein
MTLSGMKNLIKMKRKEVVRLKQSRTVNILNADIRILIHSNL